jgi:hypothetical protein
MAFGTLFRGLSGAGYDDQNNNAYRNGDDVAEKGTNRPACEAVEHRRIKV